MRRPQTDRRVTDLAWRPAPARRRLLLGLAGFGALALLAGGVVTAVRTSRGGATVDQSRPGPVLVVPGYGGAVGDLRPLVDRLRRNGRTVAEFDPSQGGTGDLRVQAKRLADLARRTMDRAGASSVDVVGYSAGGVTARLFVRDEGGASVVRRVLTIGSPHHGTDVAALAEQVGGGCPTACEQLAPGSDLLRRLNARDETPGGPRWVTIRTRDDGLVVPVDSARLQGALNLVVQQLCPDDHVPHEQLTSDPVVLAALRTALGAGRPRAPTGVSC